MPLAERYRILEEGDDVLVIEEDDGTRRSFYPSRLRTMRLRLDQTELWGYMSPRRTVGATPDTAFDQVVSGRATLVHDESFYVIGEPTSRSSSMSVSLHPAPCPEQGVADLHPKARTRADEGDDKDSAPPEDDPFAQSFEEEYRLAPATFCYSRGDASSGSESRWWLQCHLPASAFMALADAMKARKLQALLLDVRLREAFIDDVAVAPPALPVSWCLKAGSGESADGDAADDMTLVRGAVTQLSVQLADVDLSAASQARSPMPEADGQVPPEEPARMRKDGAASAVADLVASMERLRSTVKWVGAFIVLCLLLLAFN